MTDNLKTLPRKSKNINHYHIYEPNVEYQIDLMFMPTDDGYKYVFVMRDIATTLVYGTPSKSKLPSEMLILFKIF